MCLQPFIQIATHQRVLILVEISSTVTYASIEFESAIKQSLIRIFGKIKGSILPQKMVSRREITP